MGLTVKVNFPDGTREVPAHIHIPGRDDDIIGSFGYRDVLSRVTPDPMDGWEFRAIIGGRDYEWIANQCRPSSRQPWEDVRPWELDSFFASHSHFN